MEAQSDGYLNSYSRWYDYSRARDAMFKATDTDRARWHIVRSDDKRRARLNCISQLLELIPYKKVSRPKVKLPKRSRRDAYNDQATLRGRHFVAEKFLEPAARRHRLNRLARKPEFFRMEIGEHLCLSTVNH